MHNQVQTKADDAEGRQRLSRYMIRCPFSLEKMRYAPDSGMVVYRSKPHATLKRNYQLMPAIKWLRLLMNHIPDKYEHLVRYYGYYSNRSRGARRLIENGDDTAGSIRIDDTPANTRCKASWARRSTRSIRSSASTAAAICASSRLSTTSRWSNEF